MTTHRDDELDRVLDRTLDEIHGERPDPEFERAASTRVWQRLSHELDADEQERHQARRIRSCGDFQTMLPDYLAGRLVEARRLLLEDHLGECVPCRRALKDRRATARPIAVPRRAPSRGWAATMGWRVAAAAVILLTVIGFSWKTDLFSFESGGLIRIEAMDGDLFRVTDDGAVPLKLGDVLTLEEGEGIRTAKDSTAMIALADNSRVEIRERSQLAVLQRRHLFPGRRSEGQLALERGSIIVEASEQGSGHLYVDTRDCQVAVTGTVFSVSHGMKGSRVSVVEGEVHVAYRGSEDVLRPGDQTTTRDSLHRVSVEHDIAWSRNSAQYRELLSEMHALGREIDEALQPGLRYSTDLLDLVPADTVVYVAMPNISDELGRAYEILQSRVAASDVLHQWWDEHVMQVDGDHRLDQIIDKIRAFGDHLDEEIVMTVQMTPDGNVTGPLFLARVTAPGAFMQLLEKEITSAEETYDQDLHLELIEGPLSTLARGSANDAELYFWTQGDVLAMTPTYDHLWALDASLQNHDHARLAGAKFHDLLRDLYGDGVEWAVGVDLERLIETNASAHDGLADMGLLDVQHVIAERKQEDGRTEVRATLTFDQPRRRMAAWLAEPAPMGALDYVSPDANLAAAFVMKDMGVVVGELFDIVGALEDDFEESLAEFEREAGINIRRDLAEPLGGEFAVALDGPLLPTPSWKLIMEVYDPARLERTLEWLVARVNDEVAETGQSQGLSLERETVGGHDYLRLESLDTGIQVHFVFDGGYLVAGPSRGLLDRTLQNKAMGIKLTDAASFLELIPRDEQVDFSAMVYQNVAPIVQPLSNALGTMGQTDDLDQQLWASMAADAKPSLALLYGDRDRIVLASSSEGGLLSTALNQLSGAGGLLGMQQSLARALEHEVNNR
jgi:ferric-dicitrate binding protein FerR (iron transport regulator)